MTCSWVVTVSGWTLVYQYDTVVLLPLLYKWPCEGLGLHL
jgi:hypothetical protein